MKKSLPTMSLLALAGCGGETALVHTFDDGSRVRVEPSGQVVVVADDRVVFRTAARTLPSARVFTLDGRQAYGFFEFERTGEVEVPFTRVVSREETADGVVVTFGGEGDARATLRVEAGPIPKSTRVLLTVEGGVPGHASTVLPLACDEESSFLGFGEQYNRLDQRGERFPLWVQEQGLTRTGELWFYTGDAHTTYLPMPYFLDARGFGGVVRTDARVLVDLCATDPEVATFDVEQAQPVDLLVLHGPTPKAVVTQLGDLYGRPEPLHDWALGPWIGIQGGQQAVLDEADALDAASVPYTALWAQDWVGRRNFTSNQVGVRYRWDVDTTLYPDLPAMIDTLHGRSKRFLGYANPWVVVPEEHYAPMDAMGLLVRRTDGSTYQFTAASLQDGSMPDLSRAQTRDYVAGYLDAMVGDFGMDGWMCDFGEALPFDSVLADGTPGFLAHNPYANDWHDLHRARLLAARPDGDFAVFSRSGWLGAQGTAQIVWVGDQEADFSETDGLPTVVPAMLNLGLSVVPYVTHDVGGFSGGPRTLEVFQRWTELGAFTTVMRTHEGLRRAENWGWDGGPSSPPAEVDETIAHFRRFARIHEALVPYFAELVDEAAATSIPPLRALVLEFPQDPALRHVSDQFLVGPDLLVAPVVTEGATSREVVFPEGTWTHALVGGAPIVGPTRRVVDAPIGTPPVFWRGAPRVDLTAFGG